MASDLVPATWDGPYPAELPDMSLIYPGEQHLVTSEDLKSAHWKPVSPPAIAATSASPAPARPAASTTGSTSSSPQSGASS